MVEIREDFVLISHVVHLLQLDDLALLEHLEGNIFPTAFVFRQLDPSEGALIAEGVPVPRVVMIS